MKFRFDRKLLLKSVLTLVVLGAILLGAVELVFLIDLGGMDFAVTFLLLYFAAIRDTLIYKTRILKSEIVSAIEYLSELYMFQPKVFVSHAGATGIIVSFSCSLFLACLLWLPLIYLSSGFAG